jgi:hypothetical protein
MMKVIVSMPVLMMPWCVKAKCKDLIGVNIHAGQSWAALSQKMAGKVFAGEVCRQQEAVYSWWYLFCFAVCMLWVCSSSLLSYKKGWSPLDSLPNQSRRKWAPLWQCSKWCREPQQPESTRMYGCRSYILCHTSIPGRKGELLCPSGDKANFAATWHGFGEETTNGKAFLVGNLCVIL